MWRWIALFLFACRMAHALEVPLEAQHVYLFFYRDSDDPTLRMRDVFDRAVKQLKGQVSAFHIDVNDPAEASIVDYYRLKRRQMPYVLVLAPNGAAVGRFSAPFEHKALVDAIFVNPSQVKNPWPGPRRCSCCGGGSE